MTQHSHVSDYSRYFLPKQKVYLVKVLAGRGSEIYESLSGVVTSSSMNSVELMITHGGLGTHDDEVGTATYKLTCEALGSGLQVLAELSGVSSGNILRFRMLGTLELFQRRVVPRVELSVRIFQQGGNNISLAAFRKEWKRVMDHLRINGELPGVVLQETEINLSAGGVGITIEPGKRPAPLSMFYIALDGGLPVCALAETVWEQRADEGLRCGFRFIHILKSDQERINSYVRTVIRKGGGKHLDYKRNWVLVDKMVFDGMRKPE